MDRNQNGRSFCDVKKRLFVSAFALLFLLCMIPFYLAIKSIIFKIALTAFLTLIITLSGLKLKNGLIILADAMNLYLALVIGITFVMQAILQIKQFNNGIAINSWIYMFYYDKPFSVGFVCIILMIICTIKMILQLKSENDKIKIEYDKFFNKTSRGFLIYYALLLFYCFIIIRTSKYDLSSANFIPFMSIRRYINHNGLSIIENFFDFFGNLLFFAPAGFYIKIIKPKINIFYIILIPIIASSVIELSQLILKNGNCDIDDVILNSMGFYFGYIFKYIIDCLIRRKTSGHINTIFNWKKYIANYK